MSNFQDGADYPMLSGLRENWQVMLSEYLQVVDYLRDWHEPIYEGGWKVFGFRYLGQTIEHQFCPITRQLVDAIPDVTNAAFSVLKANSEIKPHVGYTDEVLRSHLGLICPDNAGIKVGADEYNWKEGELVVFNDRIEHSAYNHSDQDRVVFILDFPKGNK